MLNVTITSPNGTIVNDTTDVVICKTINGEVSFYPQHLPYLSTIRNGYVKMNNNTYDIKCGSILLDENNNVTVLVSE